jgi:hypothetical protein
VAKTVQDKTDEQTEPIKLLIKQNPNGQVDSVVYMEWCISENTKNYLIDEQVEKPYMLLLVEHMGRETDRYLAPLTAGAQYVRFRHPGINTVHATIIWSSKINLKKAVFDYDHGNYTFGLLSSHYPLTDLLKEESTNLFNQIEQAESIIKAEQLKNPMLFGLSNTDIEIVSDDITDEDDAKAVLRRDLEAQLEELERRLEALDNDDEELADPQEQSESNEPEVPDMALVEEKTALKLQLEAEIERVDAELREACDNERAVYRINPFLYYDHYSVGRTNGDCQLEVSVPKEMFAKEPPKIVKALAGYFNFWPSRAKDQCDMRRRALITLAIIVPVLIAKLIASLVMEVINLTITGVLLFFGFYDICYDAILHPLHDWPNSIWRDIDRSRWTAKRQEGSYFQYDDRPAVFWVANPPALLACLIVGVILMHWLDSLVYLIAVLVVFALVIAITGVVGIIGKDRFEAMLATRRKHRIAKHDAELAKYRLALAKELEDMSCILRPSRTPSYSTLPRQKRTVTLRFNHLKTKVCKPFAG